MQGPVGRSASELSSLLDPVVFVLVNLLRDSLVFRGRSRSTIFMLDKRRYKVLRSEHRSADFEEWKAITFPFVSRGTDLKPITLVARKEGCMCSDHGCLGVNRPLTYIASSVQDNLVETTKVNNGRLTV